MTIEDLKALFGALVSLAGLGQATKANSLPVTMASDQGSIAIGGVAGDTSSGAADAGNPVKIGGIASTTTPAAVAAGQRVNAWFGLSGRQVVCVGNTAYGTTGVVNGCANVTTIDDVARNLAVGVFGFNGTSQDQLRNNLDVTLLASAARTVTTPSADQTNYNGRGVKVVLDVTVAGTGSVTLSIQCKDPVSGNYVTVLTGAAVTTVSTNQYTVYPGIGVVANVSASDLLTRTWRVNAVANNANSMTYSVGASVIL